MIKELKTYRITCEFCPTEVIVHKAASPFDDPPDPAIGWERVRKRYEDQISYYADIDVCPSCFVKGKHKE